MRHDAVSRSPAFGPVSALSEKDGPLGSDTYTSSHVGVCVRHTGSSLSGPPTKQRDTAAALRSVAPRIDR